MDDQREAIHRILCEPAKVTGADLPLIRSMNLSGYVFPFLSETHPLKSLLRSDAVQFSTRHALIRKELRPLLEIWNEAGIPVILMKGFALAEFEYDTPGQRFYGDVDLLLPNDPEVISYAVHLAMAYGWRSDGQHARAEQWTHECAHLYSPGGQVKLDVHRFVAAWTTGPQSKVQDLTRKAWAEAMPGDWDGISIRLLSPKDRVVINLATGRLWGDGRGLKPADVIDLSLLKHRYQLTSTELTHRAEALGTPHTWAAFEKICDPEHPDFVAALQAALPELVREAQKDGASYQTEWSARLRRLPVKSIWMLRTLPDVYFAGRAWQRGGNPMLALRSWGRPVKARLDVRWQGEIISAVRWWTQILYPRQSRIGVCVPRAYATFRALRRLGHPAVFVSGVARGPNGITGHAWVEDDRGIMESYGEPLVRLRFAENFRFPQ